MQRIVTILILSFNFPSWSHITENIEQLFLNYNVDADKLESIEDSLEESLVEIQSLFEKSDKLDLPED